MKRVTPKEAGVKLNGKWCFKGQEEIISEEEYNANKEYVVVLEDIRESNERVIEVVVKDETIDIEALRKDLEKFVENYNKPEVQENPGENPEEAPGENPEEDPGENPEEDPGENPEENSGEDEELKALKAKAQELGINVTHNMKKETIIKKIEAAEKAKEGQDQNPEGE